MIKIFDCFLFDSLKFGLFNPNIFTPFFFLNGFNLEFL